MFRAGILYPDGLHLPNFLGIGAQKAATTWLDNNLRRHPQLYLPDHQKELHYFDRNYHTSLRSYTENFTAGVGKIKGEVTPSYCTISPRRIRYLQSILPDLRIVLLLRNPIDRAWSQAVMNLVKKPGCRLEDVGTEDFIAHFRSRRSLIRGDYPTILARWRSEFTERQLYVGFFEDVAERPTHVLSSIFEFLGASAVADWTVFPYQERANRGVASTMPRECRDFLVRMYENDIRLLQEEFGGPTERWLSDPKRPA